MNQYKNKTPRARIIMKTSDKLDDLLRPLAIPQAVRDKWAVEIYEHAVAQDIKEDA